MKTHYDILGIEKTAESSDIKKAYFELAKKYHPDSGDEHELQKFHEITQAYKTLSDKELKKAYDLTLEAGLEIIKAKEAEVASVSPVEPTIQVQKRELFRDVELKEFHRNRLKKAIFRVIGLTAFFGLLGLVVDWLLGGRWYLGLLAGLLMGFSISLRKNFDVSTFFESTSKKQLLSLLLWTMLIGGGVYFFVILGNFVVH